MPKSPSKTSKKKKYNARFPPARIKKIMQTDEEVGKVAAAVPVIISRALELFIESLITETSQTTVAKNAKTLSTSHIKQTIESKKQFDFLRDLVSNIPDHQTEDNNGEAMPANGEGTGKKGRGRPRKQKDTSAAQATIGESSKPIADTTDDEGEETDTEDESQNLDEPSTSMGRAPTHTVPSIQQQQPAGTPNPTPSASNGGCISVVQTPDRIPKLTITQYSRPVPSGSTHPQPYSYHHPMAMPVLPASAFPPYPSLFPQQYPYSCPVLPSGPALVPVAGPSTSAGHVLGPPAHSVPSAFPTAPASSAAMPVQTPQHTAFSSSSSAEQSIHSQPPMNFAVQPSQASNFAALSRPVPTKAEDDDYDT